MIKIAICDDENSFLNFINIKLKSILSKLDTEYIIDTFSCGSDLLKSCTQTEYDLLLLDIDMPELTGFDVSEQLKQNSIGTEIIFISGRDNFVFQSIRYHPFRFIRKSFLEQELDEAITAFFAVYISKNQLHTFYCKDYTISVSLVNITYFESFNHDLIMHMDNDVSYQLSRQHKLGALEREFSCYGFIRSHKSYLVNYRFINLIKNSDIIMKNHIILPSSKQKVSAVKSLYRKFIMEEI